jgi:hypothetical protein
MALGRPFSVIIVRMNQDYFLSGQIAAVAICASLRWGIIWKAAGEL